MEEVRGRTFSRFEDEPAREYRISKTVSFKAPNFEQTITRWQTAKRSRKPLRKRCTRSENGGFFMTNISILAISVSFCYYIAPWILSHKWDDKRSKKWDLSFFQSIILSLGVILSSLSLLFLWLTHVTDPGVIPRQTQIEYRKLEEGERNCDTCKIIRPPRAKHCRHCDHCVEVFDHHCPYAGVCIGAGNYLFFFLLLFTGFIAVLYVCIFSFWFVLNSWILPGKMQNGLRFQLILAVVVIILSGAVVFLVGHLSAYHIFIAATGQTTNEQILTKRRNKSQELQKPSTLWCISDIENVSKAQVPLLDSLISLKGEGPEYFTSDPTLEVKDKEVVDIKASEKINSEGQRIIEL